MSLFQPFPLPTLPTIPANRLSIRDLGAAGDGVTADTQVFAAAIASLAKQGGGQIYVPPGDYLTGAIHLQNHIELHLAAGATLRFSQNPADYLPVVLCQRGGVSCYNYSPFIYAYQCHDIAITGNGVIDGQGMSWWPWKQAQPGMTDLFNACAERRPIDKRVYGTPQQGVRPPFVQPLHCQRVLIEGVTFVNSPSWTIHPVWCEELTIRQVTVKNPASAPNTDAIDPDACRNVLIEHCHIDTGDDGICLKAGRDQDAWEAGIPCENVLIRHCTVLAAHGGVVLGSEMSAGIRNVLAHDCFFQGTNVGIRIKSRPGRGGFIEQIQCERIQMQDIRREAVIVTLHYPTYDNELAAGVLTEELPVPRIRDILLQDIHCSSAKTAMAIEGIAGHVLQNITLEDAVIRSQEGIRCEHAAGVRLYRVQLPE